MKTSLLLLSLTVLATAAAPAAFAAARPDRVRTIPRVAKRVRARRPAYVPKTPAVAKPTGSAPPVPAAEPVWVTDEAFALSSLQWQTKHGRARAHEVAVVAESGLHMAPTAGKYEILIDPEFVAGRDVTVQCWGKFSGPMTIGAAGQQPGGDWYAVGTVGLDRPSGATGSIEARVEGGAVADSDTLVVALWANAPGPWRLDQCIVRRVT